MNVSLAMFKSDGLRRDFPITRGKVVIGRKNTCDLRIPLSSVSRQHCEITIDGDQVLLRDLGSSNGTLLNDNRVQESLLKAGDEITIGPVVFTVVVNGKPTNIKPIKTMLTGGGSGQREAAEKPQEGGDHTMVAQGESELTTAIAENDLDAQIAALEALANDDSDTGPIDLSEEDLKKIDIELADDDES
ncbi:FHA domain-containing protein FhaA [Poriferisphaera corsica]|uniref:FHA domain-containing protein FhaA n=1 Tax=Poriferisphaera corsica TaxID=2528020 RepID=A0A517YU17_9BACT|nr:FHA domain-containing protein [Poriferisphaera corsica]QDU33716.1 FHA domain-containing protein FhaA [Poriferisphaera corsica]